MCEEVKVLEVSAEEVIEALQNRGILIPEQYIKDAMPVFADNLRQAIKENGLEQMMVDVITEMFVFDKQEEENKLWQRFLS